MTLSTQAAIEALPRYDQVGTSWPIHEFGNGAYLKREDVLAALRAAPVKALTDEEIDQIWTDALMSNSPPAFRAFARAIEARIKGQPVGGAT